MNLFPLFARGMGNMMEFARRKFPPMVCVETTNHCNARCSFCPRESMGRAKGFMDQTLYEKVVRECAEHDCPMIHLHNYGEPLLDRLLPERIKFAKTLGIRQVKIFSNGALLKGELAKALLDAGLSEIKISIDGAGESEFNEIRIGLNHDEVFRNTQNFKTMRDCRGWRYPHLIATCSRTSDKIKTKRMLRGVVDRIVYADLHNWAGARGSCRNTNIRQPCFRLWQTFTILVNGDVVPCCLDHSGKEIMGNCHDQSIADIWENKRYRELRRMHCEGAQHRIALCNPCSLCYLQLPAKLAALLTSSVPFENI